MRSNIRTWLVAAAWGLAWCAVAARAHAGVIIDTRMDVTMLAGGGQGTGRVEIEGQARREVRSLSLTAPGAEQAQEQQSDAITRLDRGVQWQLDADDSSYRAVPLARLGDAMAGAGAGGMAMPGLVPGAKSSVTWRVEVTRRKESAVIAGWRALRTDIVLTGTSHDPEAGDAATIRLVTQWWMSTAAPGAAEELAFERGFERATRGIASDVPGLLAGLPGAGDAVARLTAARRGLSGVPMRTVLRLEAPGLAAMLGGVLGGDSGGAPQGDGDAAAPLVTSTIEVTSMRVGRIAAARFALPAGFHEAPRDTPEASPPEVHE